MLTQITVIMNVMIPSWLLSLVTQFYRRFRRLLGNMFQLDHGA